VPDTNGEEKLLATSAALRDGDGGMEGWMPACIVPFLMESKPALSAGASGKGLNPGKGH